MPYLTLILVLPHPPEASTKSPPSSTSTTSRWSTRRASPSLTGHQQVFASFLPTPELEGPSLPQPSCIARIESSLESHHHIGSQVCFNQHAQKTHRRVSAKLLFPAWPLCPRLKICLPAAPHSTNHCHNPLSKSISPTITFAISLSFPPLSPALHRLLHSVIH